jgi:hypothetical protein
VERNRLTPVAHVIDGGFSEKMFPAVFVSFISIHKLSVLLLDIFNLDRDFVYSYHNSSLLFMFVGSRYDVVRIINKGPALLLSFFVSYEMRNNYRGSLEMFNYYDMQRIVKHTFMSYCSMHTCAYIMGVINKSREKSTLRQIPAPPDHFAQVEAILSKTRM